MNNAREMIVKKIRQLFPQENGDSVMEILDSYGTEDWEREKERVQLAILKLSEGNLETLRADVAAAKRDYRDILAYAEFPGEIRLSASEMSSLPSKQAKAIRAQDSKQFLDWLQNDD